MEETKYKKIHFVKEHTYVKQSQKKIPSYCLLKSSANPSTENFMLKAFISTLGKTKSSFFGLL